MTPGGSPGETGGQAGKFASDSALSHPILGTEPRNMSSTTLITEPVSRVFAPAQTANGKFLNPVPTTVGPPGQMGRILRRWVTEHRRGEPDRPLGPFHTDASVYAAPPASGLRATWMGHSTLLLEIDGVRILTDPVWSARASFVSFLGPKRFYRAPLALKNLPPLDAVLLSHDHYDHLDRVTIRKLLATGVPIVCSLGMGRLLQSWGAQHGQITELNWGETTAVGTPGRELRITATPARHFSGRSLWNRNRTLWSSFVLRGPRHNVFFGADSGPFPGFREIGDAYGPFDLTLLEIGAYDADWPDIHMGPIHAGEAHLALRGHLLLPIHWGLFNLAFHPWREPVERLLEFSRQQKIALVLPRPGQPAEITGASWNTFWWEPGNSIP